MAEACLNSTKTPGLDLDSYRLAEYEDSLKAKYLKGDDALFAETREWCEEWYCTTSERWGKLRGIVAHIRKALSALVDLALTALYTLLDALMGLLISIAGPIAKLIDEALIFMCYMAIFIANLFRSPENKYSYSKSCCGASTFLEVITDFIQVICDGAVEVYKRLLKIYYQLLGLYEKMSYSCDCERIKEERYKEELEAAMQQNGNQFDYVIGVPPPCPEIGPISSADTGEAPAGPKPKYYINVRTKDPKVSKLFKQHVEYTVLAYNKWPYGVEGYCPLRSASYAISYVTWHRYVAFLVSNWLSTSNMVTETNPTGYTKYEHAEQMAYCMTNMPTELFNYVVSCVCDTETIDKTWRYTP